MRYLSISDHCMSIVNNSVVTHKAYTNASYRLQNANTMSATILARVVDLSIVLVLGPGVID